MQARLSKMYHCVYTLYYHLVVVTEYRRRCLTAPMLARLREIAATRCAGWGGEFLELNGEPDHVHLLVSLPPNAELPGFVNNLKTTSSRLLRKEFAEHLEAGYIGNRSSGVGRTASSPAAAPRSRPYGGTSSSRSAPGNRASRERPSPAKPAALVGALADRKGRFSSDKKPRT